jgi:hypothetical protein
MPKHYRMKAAPIEIVADPTLRKLAGHYARRAWSWIKWKAAVILRLRTR